MKFLVLFAIVAFAVAAYIKADLKADRALLKNAKFDTFLAHAKQQANAMPTEGSKKAANDYIALWDKGVFFKTRNEVYEATGELDYNLDYNDRNILWENFTAPLMKEFQETFKDIAPTGLHYYY